MIGARPQFIKAAPVSRVLASTGFEEVFVHTGQHHDASMSDIFFDELGLPAPQHNLGIHGGGHGQMTGRMLEALERTIQQEHPSAVLVYGDTNSTLAGALAAAKLKIPLLHVEAGLRSFNRAMPEEINRVVTDHLSSLLFCPSRQSVANLTHEGIVSGVHFVGDVMYDATLQARQAATARTQLLDRLHLAPGQFGLCTIHRAENTDDPNQLAKVLTYLNSESGKTPLVWPLHPRTRRAIVAAGLETSAEIKLIEPLGYLDLHCLLANATSVFTDSGGLQKEAYFHHVPCVTLRNETEWVETVEAGWNRLWTQSGYKERRPIEDYGDGRASEKIAGFLAQYFA